jgi:hypothetical protein
MITLKLVRFYMTPGMLQYRDFLFDLSSAAGINQPFLKKIIPIIPRKI